GHIVDSHHALAMPAGHRNPFPKSLQSVAIAEKFPQETVADARRMAIDAALVDLLRSPESPYRSAPFDGKFSVLRDRFGPLRRRRHGTWQRPAGHADR